MPVNEMVHEYDKAAWGNGPWLSEPDRVDFTHAGLPCLLLRGPFGAWCGYVAVLPGHPWHGLGYSQCIEKHDHDDEWSCYDHCPGSKVSVHGGLTYAGPCRPPICHVPAAGESDDVWWFGFDCSHAYDYVPRLAMLGSSGLADVYRDLAYVRYEAEQLAEQLASLVPDVPTRAIQVE